jgi:hypothetical protein
LTGPVGPQGSPGANGINGTNGADGKTVLNGSSNPTSLLGNNGDFYINTSTNTIFGPKAAGAWPSSGTSLVGPQGVPGVAGPQGSIGLQGPQGPSGSYIAGAGITILDNTISVNQNQLAQQFQGIRRGFSSSGNWTCPNGVFQVIVEVWGAGGGGAFGQSGGKGGYNRNILNVIPGNVYEIIIGNGGIAQVINANGQPPASSGGTSSFDGILSAGGGSGASCCFQGGSATGGSVINWPYESSSAPNYIPSHYFNIPSLANGGTAGDGVAFFPAPTNGLNGFCIISY